MNKKKVLTIFKCSENCRFGEQTDCKIEMKNFGFSTFYIYISNFFHACRSNEYNMIDDMKQAWLYLHATKHDAFLS